jgi:GntR family transcriptional regulator
MTQINRSSKLPLYYQLYEILSGKIERRDWVPGDMIPPESRLSEEYQVSRITVRQVLDMLANEGLINRERGRGTFVAQPKVDQALVRIISFTEDMNQRGIHPETRSLVAKLMPAPSEIAKELQIETGEELAYIMRLRLGDGMPMSVEESYLVHKLCPGILKQDIENYPMRGILDRVYGVRWLRARQVIRAMPVPRHLAKTLGTQPNASILFIERVSYSTDNTPVEFLHIYHRGDRYELFNELKG